MNGQNSNFNHKAEFVMWAMRILWVFFCIIAFSNAGTDMMLWIAAFYMACALGVSWLIRLFIAWWRRKKGHPTHKFYKSYWRYWLIDPAIIAIPLLLASSGLFSSLRFALSEPALSRYVSDVRAGKVDVKFEFSHPARQVGLYRVTVTELLPDGTVRIITSGHGLLGKAGFAHSLHTLPPRQAENEYQYIQQHWWYWYENW